MVTLESISHTLGKIESDMRIMKEELHQVKRGVYGDPANKTPGLIDTDISQHHRIKKLEEVKNKFLWTAGGITAVVSFILYLLKK